MFRDYKMYIGDAFYASTYKEGWIIITGEVKERVAAIFSSPLHYFFIIFCFVENVSVNNKYLILSLNSDCSIQIFR